MEAVWCTKSQLGACLTCAKWIRPPLGLTAVASTRSAANKPPASPSAVETEYFIT
jgi:hypothetical protein